MNSKILYVKNIIKTPIHIEKIIKEENIMTNNFKLTGTAIAVIIGFIAIISGIFLPKNIINSFGNRIIVILLGIVFSWLGIWMSRTNK